MMKIVWAQQDFPLITGKSGIFLAGPTYRASALTCNMCFGGGEINYVNADYIDEIRQCPECEGTGRLKLVSWRLEAIQILKNLGFQGELYVPEPEDCGSFSSSHGKRALDGYNDQVKWEREGLRRSKVILFWIPRDIQLLPGFTTNIEFGEWSGSGKCVLGYPADAHKMGVIKYIADEKRIPTFDTLEDTLKKAVDIHLTP